MTAVLARVRALLAPFTPQIVKDEPALATAAAGIVTDVALDLGLHLSASASAVLVTATGVIVGKVIRELVTPKAKAAKMRAKPKKA